MYNASVNWIDEPYWTEQLVIIYCWIYCCYKNLCRERTVGRRNYYYLRLTRGGGKQCRAEYQALCAPLTFTSGVNTAVWCVPKHAVATSESKLVLFEAKQWAKKKCTRKRNCGTGTNTDSLSGLTISLLFLGAVFVDASGAMYDSSPDVSRNYFIYVSSVHLSVLI